VIALVEALLRARVPFCAWKSNEHLTAACAGETDLDLLVDREHATVLREIVAGLGIKALVPPVDGRHPATEHFLGLDDATGTLFHVHVQYELVLGEKYIKNYMLPMERVFLDSTQQLTGVPVPRPEVELAVLATRTLLKYRLRDIVKDTLHVRSPGVPAETRAEIAWLRNRTTIADVRALLQQPDGVLPVEPICAFLELVERTTRGGTAPFRLRAQVRRALRPYRRRGTARAGIAYARGAWLRGRRLRTKPADLRMMPVAGGGAVAFVGPDGSGKSTLTGAVDGWLGWKLQTRVYYLGSKAPSVRSRALYIVFRALRRTHRASSARFEHGAELSAPIAGVRDTVRALHCLSIGRDRSRRYRRALREARTGRVVIFDRFPLESLSRREDHRLFDGPQIPSVLPASRHPIARWLAAAEARLYRQFRLPEHVVMLEVEPDVAIARKPDHDEQVVTTKCEALGELVHLAEAEEGVHVARVDANQPADVVLREVKDVVWHVV
jgi:thymidylate kinase